VRSLLPTPASQIDREQIVELYRFQPDRPWVRGIFVSSVDGAVQGGSGTSGGLSTSDDKAIFALQRSLCDLILVGAGTARAEGYRPVQTDEIDAQLRQRLGLTPVPPIAVVTRSPDWDSPTLQGGRAPSIVVTTEDAPLPPERDRAARTISAGEGMVDIAGALDQLAAAGHRRIVCEGGPTLMDHVVAAGRLDDLCLTISPLMVSGQASRLLGGAGLEPAVTMSLAHLLEAEGALFTRYVVDR